MEGEEEVVELHCPRHQELVVMVSAVGQNTGWGGAADLLNIHESGVHIHHVHRSSVE